MAYARRVDAECRVWWRDEQRFWADAPPPDWWRHCSPNVDSWSTRYGVFEDWPRRYWKMLTAIENGPHYHRGFFSGLARDLGMLCILCHTVERPYARGLYGLSNFLAPSWHHYSDAAGYAPKGERDDRTTFPVCLACAKDYLNLCERHGLWDRDGYREPEVENSEMQFALLYQVISTKRFRERVQSPPLRFDPREAKDPWAKAA